MKNEDIWDLSEKEEYYEDCEYECQMCYWKGNDPYVLKEFGMVWMLCPECGGECL